MTGSTGGAPANQDTSLRDHDVVEPDPAAGEYVQRLRGRIADQKDDLAEADAPRAAFFLFFSFDLVNSTLYKTLNRRAWPLVTQKFYEYVEDALRKRIDGIRLWKYVGDELLLYRRINRLHEIRECLPAVYQTLVRTVREMQREELHRFTPEARTVLSVKATVWCALVHELPPSELRTIQDPAGPPPSYRNIVVRQPGAGGAAQLDFLGPEIDTGFRIAKFASRQRVVVSADLAYLLYRDRASNDPIERQLRLVAYEQLKGVWGNRHYPIFWYEPDWSVVTASFGYDEHFQNEIVRHLSKEGPQGELREISKIYNDLDRAIEADQLWSFVHGLAEDPAVPEVPAASSAIDRATEVHCVAVCFRSDGKALAARRPNSKKRFPGLWEFGCGQLAPYESFADCLRRAYKDDFGAELRVSDTPTPVRTYIIHDQNENRQIPGIIFVADVLNPEALHARNHQELEWVDPEQPGSLIGASCVPDFEMTLRKAAAVRQRGNAQG